MERIIKLLRTLALVLTFALLFSGAAAFLSPVVYAGEESEEDNLTSWRENGFSSVLYDNTNGLPTSDANAVVQSDDGFLWIGSYSGLIRYDGNEFYRYDSSSGVSSVVSLFEDSKGRLWIGTNDSGIFMLEKEKFISYDREEGLKSSSVRSIEEDDNGNILAATTMGMAYIGPEGTMHQIDDPQINQEYICELVKGTDGTIYGITNLGSFFTIEDLRLTAFYEGKALGVGMVNTVYPDPDDSDCIYIGTQSATIVYGNLKDGMKEKTVIDVNPYQSVRCIKKYNGRLWLCAEGGIGYIENGELVNLSELPMTNSIEHMIVDFEGNMWFTSSRQGLMKIVDNKFLDIFELASLEEHVVNSTYVKNGLLYIGTDTGLIILDKKYEEVTNEITEFLEGGRIRSIHEDSNGLLWFGTNTSYGLVSYDPDSGKINYYCTENGLASDRARTMMELSDGLIVVATNAGVNIIENGKVVALYNGDNGISNLEILCLEESPDGKIMAGSDGDGIYTIDHGKVTRLGKEDGLKSEVILRIRKDPVTEDLYWIITSNSIAYLKDGKITTINNFPYSNNFDMYFDSQNRIWILCSNGIYVVLRDSLLQDENINYIHYDTSCGLPCSATANSYSYLGPEGDLYIAASTGVSRINIEDAKLESSSVKLNIPYLMADDEYIEIKNGTARVPESCKKLKVCAYAFTYSLGNPVVRYSMNGFDDSPTELSHEEMGPVTYTNLPGGNYEFTLSLVNSLTREEDETVTVKIIKEKKITEQLWFKVVCVLAIVLAVGLIVFLYYRKKTKALLKKEEEHRQLINEITSVFASCIDLKDGYTNGHSHRVAKYTSMIAERLGKSPEEIEEMHRIALLHDIGKIGIPDNILNKPGKLDDDEYAVMKSHSQRGYDILKAVSIAPELAIGAGFHHERMDGRGYPKGLKGEDIPEVAEIIAVADTFDAMYSTRPYRRRMELSDIYKEIERCKGTQLNEKAAGALLQMIDEGIFNDDRPE